MYFSKQEFIPDAEVAEMTQRAAQKAIQMAKEDFDVILDGTGESISGLDMILDRMHRSISRSTFPETEAQRLGRVFGSYFGEVLRQEQGATWGVARIFSDYVPALSVGPKEIVLAPWHKVSERIIEGAGVNLRTYYETIFRSIQAGEKPVDESVTRTLEGKAGDSPVRLFTLRHDQGYFAAGTCRDGRQILMNFFWTGLTAIFFDREGNLLECEVRPLPAEPTFHPRTSIPLETPDFEARMKQIMKAWRREIGFHPEPIRVRQFSVPEQGLGIEIYPSYYEEFLKAPELEEPDEGERLEVFQAIREWEERRDFVLYWGNDLYLNAEGEVTSS